MREIKFRGLTDAGVWVVGDLERYSEHMSYIVVDLLEQEVYEVRTETVGQYTGLKDRNGCEIYEGDLLLEKDALVVEDVTKGDGWVWSRPVGRSDKWYRVLWDDKLARFDTVPPAFLDRVARVAEVSGTVYDEVQSHG